MHPILLHGSQMVAEPAPPLRRAEPMTALIFTMHIIRLAKPAKKTTKNSNLANIGPSS